MKPAALLCTLLFGITLIPLPAQVKTFQFKKSDLPITNHPYEQVEVLDGRNDKRNIGIVQIGLSNLAAAVMIDTFP